jgi:Rieske Fe-S protein
MSHSVELHRRELLAATGAVAAAAIGVCACGCASNDDGPAASAPANAGQANIERPTGPVEIGTVQDYPHDGTYDAFAQSDKVLVVRRGGQLYAMSCICTHRKCNVRVGETDLRCPCHGSRYDLAGHVTKGPASHDLPRYAIVNAGGKLTVNRSEVLPTKAPGVPV